MMLAGDTPRGPLRVALATTHLPLKDVPAAITAEVLTRTLRILDAAGAAIAPEIIEVGEAVYKRGELAGIAPEAWESLRRTKVFLKAPITTPQGGGYKSLNVTTRKALGLYANLRPVKPSPALIDASPLKKELIDGTDLLVVRELTGGIYFGDSGGRDDGAVAYDECAYSVPEIQRIARAAFEAARQRSDSPRVLSVDKANVLETSRLWRETVKQVATEYPDVELDHLLVDFAAMKLVSAPAEIDVIVTENLFGDILSDEAAMLTGSLGMLPSASIGAEGQPGLFEPVHGSAPDIAGQGIANPLAAILSFEMALRWSLDQAEAADKLYAAVIKALDSGARTRDLGGALTTAQMGDAVIAAL